VTVYSRSHPIVCQRLLPTRTTLLHVYATVHFMTKSSRMLASLHLPSFQSMLPMPSTSSSAATSQDEQQDVDQDDDAADDHRSQNTSVLTSAEHADAVIQKQQIALDTRLAIFTVNGTSESRVVRLFPTTTCSCPAKSNCYHILSARLAVGINGESCKRTVNVTQLCKNTRKCPDKTSGRKCARLDNVLVVAAGDADDDVTAALHAAVSTATEQTVATVPGISTAASAFRSLCETRHLSCMRCGKPSHWESQRRKIINWVCCDECDDWYHMCCVHLATVPDTYTNTCGLCN